MEKRVVLSVGEKEVWAYRDQIPVASRQNITHHFSLRWDKPISQQCICDIPSEKYRREKSSNFEYKKKGEKHKM